MAGQSSSLAPLQPAITSDGTQPPRRRTRVPGTGDGVVSRRYGSVAPICKPCKDFFAFQVRKRANPPPRKRRTPHDPRSEKRFLLCLNFAQMRPQLVGKSKESRRVTEGMGYDHLEAPGVCAVCHALDHPSAESEAAVARPPPTLTPGMGTPTIRTMGPSLPQAPRPIPSTAASGSSSDEASDSESYASSPRPASKPLAAAPKRNATADSKAQTVSAANVLLQFADIVTSSSQGNSNTAAAPAANPSVVATATAAIPAVTMPRPGSVPAVSYVPPWNMPASAHFVPLQTAMPPMAVMDTPRFWTANRGAPTGPIATGFLPTARVPAGFF